MFSNALEVAREETEMDSSMSMLMVDDAQNLKIVGWKGVCILGYAKFLVTGMQLDRSQELGGNAFAYPKKYSNLSWVLKIFCLQR